MIRSLPTTLVTFLLLAAPLTAQDRPPERLRGGLLLTPPEAAGTSSLPELDVAVEIDERGRVVAVEVERIRPQGELDEVFRRATREQILEWRYAPRLEDGQPVPTILRFKLQYQTHAAGSAAGTTVIGSGQLQTSRSAMDGREEWARRMLELPPKMRRQRLQEAAETALDQLDPATRQRTESPHFVLFTDLPDEKTAEILVQNLEGTLGTLVKMLGHDLPFYPERLKLIAVVYAGQESYLEVTRQLMSYEHSAGFYHPLGLLAFHYDHATPGQVLATLLHEATHAVLDRYVVRPGVRLPVWLSEGFAEYIGNSRIRRGRLQPGRTQSRELFLTPWGVAKWATGSKVSGEDLKRQIKRDEAPSVSSLLAAPSETYYGDDTYTYYAMGWLMVHYLRHGEKRWADEIFPRLLLYAAEGWPVDSLIAELYGLEGPRLQDGFEEHVKRLY